MHHAKKGDKNIKMVHNGAVRFGLMSKSGPLANSDIWDSAFGKKKEREKWKQRKKKGERKRKEKKRK